MESREFPTPEEAPTPLILSLSKDFLAPAMVSFERMPPP